MLEYKDVSVSLNGGGQSTHFSLIVESGDAVCISGPRYSGKSDILLATLGLQPLKTGFITLDGELITPGSSQYFRNMMAYIPQKMPDSSIDVNQLCAYFKLKEENIAEFSKPVLTKRINEFAPGELQLLLLQITLQLDKKIILIDNIFPSEQAQTIIKKLTSGGAEVVYTCEKNSMYCDKLITL